MTRRSWAAAFCLLALGITYGMVANVITLIGTIFAERLMYLPSAFFVVLAALALARLPIRAGGALLVLLLVLASLKTVTYARRWNDRLAFYEAAVAEQPRSVQVYLLLSNELRLRRQFDRAEEVAARVRRLAPDHWEVYYYSALVALDRGDLDAAESFASQALDRKKLALPAMGVAIEVQERRAATQPAATQPGATRPAATNQSEQETL